MEQFRYSICEPLNPEIIEMGVIDKEKIIETFEGFPWLKYLKEMDGKKQEEIHYSPSLEFENLSTRHGLCFSIVDNNEFYIFYKRPAILKSFFGLIKREVQDHMTDITGQTKDDALKILQRFLNNDTSYLSEKIK